MGKAWLRQYGLVIAVGILVAVVSIVIFCGAAKRDKRRAHSNARHSDPK